MDPTIGLIMVNVVGRIRLDRRICAQNLDSFISIHGFRHAKNAILEQVHEDIAQLPGCNDLHRESIMMPGKKPMIISFVPVA